jgi:EAL domain-containing protein (putative c-di-GMP-specific phosphodiesterase class I)/CheY-like chemotaxis protein
VNATATSELSKVRILVVDDEAFVRDVTVRALKSLGVADVLQACDGKQALSMLDAAAAAIDLIICDLLMPDMDGVELVRHLADRRPSPAILFASGVHSAVRRAAESLARAYGLKVVGSFAKPIAKAQLEGALKSWSASRDPRIAGPRIEIERDELNRAIANGELLYHYQPKMKTREKRLDSVEALARWQHPKHGLLGPGAFLPVAEAGDLIAILTEVLVASGFRQAAAWQKKGLRIPIAVNLSPAILSDVSMPDRFAEAAAQCGVDPESIILEITETGVALQETVYLEIITRLQMKGFRLSIDDFGTGQSSLQRLEALPFTELKIDRQFVHGIHESEPKLAIFEACIALARRFDLKVVAEGVEAATDLKVIEATGCDVVQGFIFSKALAAHDLEAWLGPGNRGANA